MLAGLTVSFLFLSAPAILLISAQPYAHPLTLNAVLDYHLPHPDHTDQPSIRILQSSFSAEQPTYTLHAVPTTIYRPRSSEALLQARLRSLIHAQSEAVEWDRVEVLGPDVEDRHTLVQLARMAANAYAKLGEKNWYDIDPAWNIVSSPYSFVLYLSN